MDRVYNCVSYVCSEGYEWEERGLEIDDMLISLYFKGISWSFNEKYGIGFSGKIGKTINWYFGSTQEVKINYPVLLAKSDKTLVLNIWQQYPSLYKKFANLQPTKNNILQFANSFGNIKDYYFHKNVISKNGVKSYSVDNIFIGCSYEEWRKEIFEMFENVKLLEIIQRFEEFDLDDIVHIGEDLITIWLPIEALPKWVYPCESDKMFDEKTQNLLQNILSQSEGKYLEIVWSHKGNYRIETIRKSSIQQIFEDNVKPDFYFSPEGKLQILKYTLMKRINKKITNNVTLRNLINPQTGEIDEFIFSDNLLTTMYLQLNNDFLKKRNIKRCLYCGEYFTPVKENQYYCPEEAEIIIQEKNKFIRKIVPTGKHCKNYDYTKNKPKIIDMYKKGMTIEEISTLTGRPIEQIKRWVKR